MRAVLLTLLLAVALPVLPAASPALPQPPCAADVPSDPYPGYADANGPPAVAGWHDVDLGAQAACGGRLQGHFSVVVAIAGKFRFAGTLDDLAERVGAISKTVGMQYWSTSDQSWRTLISRASAIRGPDGDWSSEESRRSDFTAPEMRSGKMLWFRQDDTRSTGDNLYSMRALESTPDRLAVEVVNESPIDFTILELFGEHELMSLHVIERLDGDLWGYYGVGAVRGETFGDDRSVVNRAAAFFRFLQDRPGDAAPPLAK
jgi:hypothetical protein